MKKWLQGLMPEGFPSLSSTVISGPGETGKPLIAFAFILSGLKSNGSVIVIPLQYPTAEFMRISMSKLYNINLENYRERIAYIQFDPSIDRYRKVGNNTLKANLVKTTILNETIKHAENMVEKSDLGTLVFDSALNLLFFSPTYKEKIVECLRDIIKNDKSRTYLYAVSTSVFANEIKVLEDAVDNLM